MYACADEANFGFSLGLSVDSGAHFTPLFHKPALELKACAKTTPTGLYCPQAWVGEQALLGIDAGAPEPLDSGSSASEAGAEGGSAPTDAGSADAAPERDASVVPVTSNGSSQTSSGCALSPSLPPARTPYFWLIAGMAFAVARTRRARGCA